MKKLESTVFSAELTDEKGRLAGKHKKMRKDKSFGNLPLLSFLYVFKFVENLSKNLSGSYIC